nr:MAG TPA: hypothetical protein [Caudoviricetes sp.]
MTYLLEIVCMSSCHADTAHLYYIAIFIHLFI